MNKKLTRLSVGVLACALTACGLPLTPTASEPEMQSTSAASGYPAGVQELGGYPPPNILLGTIVPKENPPLPPVNAPQPPSGKASISGVFYSRSTLQIVPETAFYLTPANGESGREPPAIVGEPDTRRGDVLGQTDASGQFVLADVPPGSYYMFLWAPYDWRPVEMNKDDQTPRLIELMSDQIAPLGVMYVTWP